MSEKIYPVSVGKAEGLTEKENGSEAQVMEVRSSVPALTGVSEAEADEVELTEAEEVPELCYQGIPYVDIADELLYGMGKVEVEAGERNTMYFALANYMRYICEFDKDLLLRVLPSFGLSEEERRVIIAQSLGRPRKTELPLMLLTAISSCQREQDVEMASSLSLPRSYQMELPKLPKLLDLLCRRLPEEYRAPLLVALLPVMGTLATRVRFNYLDGQEQSLSFFSCITAPPASGKSFLRNAVNLLLTPINEQDAIEREKERKYKEQTRTAKNSKFQPQDPHACPRNNGVSISVAKLLQLMSYAEGKHLIGFGEEMDTLVKGEKAGSWSQKSDIYRLAFDNATYGQSYMSENSFSAHIPVYYNLLLTGTPNSMRRFFNDMENGMVTRVSFARLPDMSFRELPIFEPYSAQERAEIIRWARRLDTEEGTLRCAVVTNRISHWLEAKRMEAIEADSHAMDTFRRRAAVIGFRAGMLCYLLENHHGTKLVGDFAEWMAEYVFRNQMELWGKEMELSIQGYEERPHRGDAMSLIDALPSQFGIKELVTLRSKRGQSITPASIKMLISRWKQNNRIVKIGEGMWEKAA